MYVGDHHGRLQSVPPFLPRIPLEAGLAPDTQSTNDCIRSHWPARNCTHLATLMDLHLQMATPATDGDGGDVAASVAALQQPAFVAMRWCHTELRWMTGRRHSYKTSSHSNSQRCHCRHARVPVAVVARVVAPAAARWGCPVHRPWGTGGGGGSSQSAPLSLPHPPHHAWGLWAAGYSDIRV